MNSAQLSISSPSAGGLRIVVRGHLSVQTLDEVWTQAAEAVSSAPAGPIVVDLSELEYCDGSGLALFAELRMRAAAAKKELVTEGAKPQLAQLLKMSTLRDATASELKPVPQPGFISNWGERTASLFSTMQAMVAFAGELTLALVWAVTHPRKIRWMDMLTVAEKAGVNAVPVVLLLGGLVGAILAFQIAVPLQRYGAVSIIPSILGISVARELGPLITAIIMAGRTGSAFAAELGTMKVTEEINALSAFGLEPVRFLAVPRLLAVMVVAPLLTVMNIIVAILCGYPIMLKFGYSFWYYTDAVQHAVTYVDLLGGVCKAPVFGLLIASIGCLQGLKTRQGPSAVGDSTTRAVVAGIVLIIMADLVFGVAYFFLGI